MRYRNIYCLLFLSLFLFSGNSFAQFFSKKEPVLLAEDEAFKVNASIDERGAIKILWSIADGYYMYRDQFVIKAADSPQSLGELAFPKGQIEDDPEFGSVEVYFFNAEISAQLLSNDTINKPLTIELQGQGCNKPVGVCYPPLNRTISLDISKVDLDASATELVNPQSQSAQTNTDQPIKEKTFLAYILAALGAGILLSFTPCVLPMIPILAGIIAGQKEPNKYRSGWLAICYVAGTITTYIAAGAIAGATGAQLQAYFQHPYVISFICFLLIVLALSLFGVFKIQLPSSLQSKLNSASSNSKSASITSYVLGLISALVVGACVSPVLILALGAAISQGDPVLGAGIMGAMALGMGLLLIAFGFGAGWLLPKTGAWMQQIQIIFGFMVLAVALYLLSAFDAVPLLLLSAILLMSCGLYLWQLSYVTSQPLLNSLIKALAVLLLIWGCLCVVGFATGSRDVTSPLSNLALNKEQTPSSTLPFTTTTTLSEVTALLDAAKQNKQKVLIDFYADWCLDCKRMHRTTFKDSKVAQTLKGWMLIEIDVTKTSEFSEEVKQAFNVFGPPAILFYDASGNEVRSLRQYGYMSAQQFISHIESGF